jgi:hypothetical protein
VECAPELACDEQILALHNASGDDVFERRSYFVLILVAEGTVNVSVSGLNGVNNGGLDLARGRLPRSQAKGGDAGAGVERDGGGHGWSWVKNMFRGACKHKLGEGGVHDGLGARKFM